MSAPEFERRYVEFRAAEDGSLSGTVVRFGDRARFGAWSEEFRAGSLSYSDVIVNLQHDRARPVARTGAGLTLTESATELRAAIAFPETTYAREARELVTAGILRGFSMEFVAGTDTWEGRHRVVSAAELTGIGLVDRPAYSDSQIALRFAGFVKHAGDDARHWYWV